VFHTGFIKAALAGAWGPVFAWLVAVELVAVEPVAVELAVAVEPFVCLCGFPG
jgi:hypothetical protein